MCWLLTLKIKMLLLSRTHLKFSVFDDRQYNVQPLKWLLGIIFTVSSLGYGMECLHPNSESDNMMLSLTIYSHPFEKVGVYWVTKPPDETIVYILFLSFFLYVSLRYISHWVTPYLDTMYSGDFRRPTGHRRRKCERCSPNSLQPIFYFGSIWELYVLDLKTKSFL